MMSTHQVTIASSSSSESRSVSMCNSSPPFLPVLYSFGESDGNSQSENVHRTESDSTLASQAQQAKGTASVIEMSTASPTVLSYEQHPTTQQANPPANRKASKTASVVEVNKADAVSSPEVDPSFASHHPPSPCPAPLTHQADTQNSTRALSPSSPLQSYTSSKPSYSS
jgi:hypothetical protein